MRIEKHAVISKFQTAINSRQQNPKSNFFKMDDRLVLRKMGFFSGIVVGPSPSVLERVKMKKIMIIHDGVKEAEMERFCMVIDGRCRFRFAVGSEHVPVNATVRRLCVDGLGDLLSEGTVSQWVQCKPDITVLVVGQQDIVKYKLFRCPTVYADWAKGDIEELVEKARELVEDKEEFDLRMKEGHWFLFATPKCLMEDVEGLSASEYQDIKLKHTAMMIQKREEFHASRIITFKVGEDIIVDMGRAISKLLCFRCSSELDTFGTPVRCFEMGGCDDPKGASLLRAIRERESS